MAGGGEGETLSDTPEWRIAVLVAAFIVVTLLWEKLMHKINSYLSAKHRVGLRHIVHKLEEELLALGLISLLLIALQESIAKICVNQPGDYEESYEYSSKSKSIKHRLRRLAAAAGGNSCPKGQESLWSITAMHQAHIFIFTLAVTHIVYAMLSMLICMYKLKKWEKWEKSMDHRLLAIPDKRLLSQDNAVIGYIRAFMASVMESIDRSVYLGLRRLFIERMSLTDSFNFHEFLVSSMEEEFSKVVKLDWVIWVLVGIWILAPPYVVFIMTGMAVVVMVAVGTKLERIGVHLTQKAFESYALPRKKKPEKGPSLLRKSLARISKGVLGRKSQTEEEVAKEPAKSPSTFKPHRDDLDLHMDSNKTDARVERRNSFTFEEKKNSPLDRMSTDDHYNRGDSVAVNIDQGNERRGHQSYPANDGGQMSSDSSSDDEADDPGVQAPNTNGALKMSSIGGVSGGRHQFESSREFLGAHERIPVPMRIANWTRGVVTSDKYNRNMQLMRNQTFAESYEVEDSAELFWFQKPRLLLKAMQYIYFETSLLLAILLFNLWQDTSFIISKEYGHPNWLTFGLVVLGLLLMMHSAYFVLPVYALTMAAGSHCPQSILRLAKKKKIKPEMVSALERMSGKIVNSARHPNAPLVTSGDHDIELVGKKVDLSAEHGGVNQTSLSTLLGAMYKETAKNFIRTTEQDRVQSETVDSSPARPRLMHTRSSGLLARASMGSEISPGSPSRRSSSQKAPFGSFQTRSSIGAEQANNSGNEIQMEDLKSPSLPLPRMSTPPTGPSTGPGLDQDGQLERTSAGSEQGSAQDASQPHYDEHLRSKLAALTTSAEGSEGTPKMPSQTILERPSEYARKCTVFGNRPTLYEVALLFQKAESFTTDQNNRDRPFPRKGLSGP